ncbi:MAG: NAD(P)-binding domain-containing protein, partial [Parasporobacterium sp.]|nr:NAD(P)-binding domain-containing protein [Parasporobacterium sp.]
MKSFSDIKKIAVLGAGTMGPGIAQVYAMGGYEVTMWTRSESTRDKALASLKTQLDTFEAEELLEEPKDIVLGRISFASTVEECVAGADFIQETIVEKADAKIELYDKLLKVVPKDVIIASNTSALNLFEILPAEILPQQIICHWYAPPHVIPLVEVVKSEQAPQEIA